MISFARAKQKDAETLTKIQVKAFQYDVKKCGSGPPGFDSVIRQKECIDQYDYYLILNHQTIIGGFYINRDNNKCELIRVFIDPAFQNKGIGSKVLIFLETQSGIDLIELEASDFNIKNQDFYRNRGYSAIKKKYYTDSSYSVVFQKRIDS